MSLNQIEIYQGEIWTKSGCLDFENTFVKMVEQMLTVAGYQRTDQYFSWQKQQRRVYIAVVDDVVRFDQPGQSALDLMTDLDILVTDNWVSQPIQPNICGLPRSWTGIYHYIPDALDEQIPTRDVGFCVNRLDHERLAVFCELARVSNLEHSVYGNVNCEAHDQNLTAGAKQEMAHAVFQSMQQPIQHSIDATYWKIKKQLPFRNHDLTVEQVHAASRVNIVMETYCQDHTVALSEKIFRALVTARPWVIYAGRYAVARLRQLGFDVLDDLVDHNSYDHLTSRDQLKYQVIVSTALHTANACPVINHRCQQAAAHNQQLLAHYRSQLAVDMGTWFRDFAQKL